MARICCASITLYTIIPIHEPHIVSGKSSSESKRSIDDARRYVGELVSTIQSMNRSREHGRHLSRSINGAAAARIAS